MADMRRVYGERRRPDPRLPGPPLTWPIAAFHVGLLVAVAVLSLHLVGALGGLLSGLSTLAGIGVYFYLWAITWWTNRRVLERSPLQEATDAAGARALLISGVVWGGITGLAVVLVPLLALAAAFVVNGELTAPVLVLVFGATGGTVVGALLGGVLSLVDVLLVRIAARIVPVGRTVSS